MLISIIIPAYNASATLEQCIEACRQQTYSDIEVIVVDDGSTDATGRIAESYPVRCIRQENRGPAAARNRGARAAQGSLLAFTDADCVPQPDWIARLAAGLREGIVAVGGAYGIANPGRWLARMIHTEIAARHARFDDEVDFLGSYNVLYRRNAFEAAGGFDETFSRASAEDNDLAYRLTDAGGRLGFCKDAVVAHYHPTKLGLYLRTQFRHGYWRMKLYAKHPGRARGGDRYAGSADLAAPVLALGVVGLTMLTGICAMMTTAPLALKAALLISMAAYVITRAGLTAGIVRASGDARMIGFAAVAALRDIARGLGMLAGIGRFLILAKWTPERRGV